MLRSGVVAVKFSTALAWLGAIELGTIAGNLEALSLQRQFKHKTPSLKLGVFCYFAFFVF